MQKSVLIFFAVCIVIFNNTCESIDGVTTNQCNLHYQYPVEEKPDIFVILPNSNLGICRIRNEETSSDNLFVQANYSQNDPGQTIRNLHHDVADDTIIFSTNEHYYGRIYSLRLSDNQLRTIFNEYEVSFAIPEENSEFYDMDKISYDWVTKNVYINNRIHVKVVNAKNPWNFTVILNNREDISQIAVHPNEGYLYFEDAASGSDDMFLDTFDRSIYRCNLDGSGIIEFGGTRTEDKEITDIAIDFFEDKLYWTIRELNQILYADLDGKNIKTIDHVPINKVFYKFQRRIDVDQDYLYYISKNEDRIHRLMKKNFIRDQNFELRNEGSGGKIFEISLSSGTFEAIKDNHPCVPNNGGCQQYCFAVPENNSLKKVCSCSYQQYLADDGVSCISFTNAITMNVNNI